MFCNACGEQLNVGGTIVRNLDQMTDEWLNQLGAEGWEAPLATGTGTTTSKAYLVFKRPVG